MTEELKNDDPESPSMLESVDDQMIGLMRLILALSALLIIYIDPSEPNHFVALTYAALIVYSIYSGILFFLSLRHQRSLPTKSSHWIDVACYLGFVALSSGTNSVFFFFFFFAILIASFRWGFKAGLQVTIVSTVLFTPIAFATSPSGGNFELNRFLLRPIYLLVLGYMMAYWGGFEITLKRRLNLLKEVSALANPRFGIEHMLLSVMKKLRAFFEAELCLLIFVDPQTNQHRLMRVDRSIVDNSARAEWIPETLAQLLLALPEALAVVYKGKRRRWFTQRVSCYAFDTIKRERTEAIREACESLASQLEAGSLVAIPIYFHGKAVGRLYLTSARRIFANSDIDFLMQVFKQAEPIVDNIRLLERLTSNAAELERQRLARDLHDSVIQPYLGLQYKLAAIRNRSRELGSEMAEDIQRLFQFTANEINNLRGFVGGLKETDKQADDLVSALRRFAEQFKESYDIDVRIECQETIDVNDRLAAETLSILHEGLSNIRKHTESKYGAVGLERKNNFLVVRIENEITNANGSPPALFRPKSISERAEDLGGHARVEQRDGRSIVTIDIPL